MLCVWKGQHVAVRMQALGVFIAVVVKHFVHMMLAYQFLCHNSLIQCLYSMSYSSRSLHYVLWLHHNMNKKHLDVPGIILYTFPCNSVGHICSRLTKMLNKDLTKYFIAMVHHGNEPSE